MRTLTAQELVSVWETGQTQHPVDRALTMLAPIVPRADRHALAALSVGARDALLLALREQTFGRLLHGLADCPACGVQVELAVTTDELRAPAGSDARAIVRGDFEVALRPVDSFDLAAVATAATMEAARDRLVARCVTAARRGGEAVAPGELPAEVVDEIEELLRAADPQADVRIAFACPGCSHQWRAPFDIATFLWSELRTQARRLLQDVAELARVFAWSETELLAMSPERRAFYLELVRA